MLNLLGETDLRKERQFEGIEKAKAEGRYKGRPATMDLVGIRAAYRAGDRPPMSRDVSGSLDPRFIPQSERHRPPT
jgi:DNA invertase Pin-like site-specific DNA recombinase